MKLVLVLANSVEFDEMPRHISWVFNDCQKLPVSKLINIEIVVHCTYDVPKGACHGSK